MLLHIIFKGVDRAQILWFSEITFSTVSEKKKINMNKQLSYLENVGLPQASN